jgi:hypothetical protein
MSPRARSGSGRRRAVDQHRGRKNRKSPASFEGTLELVDRLFAEQVMETVNGRKRRLSRLQALILQLWQKEMSGDAKALGLRLRYETLAGRKPQHGVELVFLDRDEASLSPSPEDTPDQGSTGHV